MMKRKNVEHKVCPKCGELTMVRGSKAQSGKMRWLCRKGGVNCYQTTNPDAPYRGRNKPKVQEEKIEYHQPLRGKRRFVITWAQNATPIHEGFFAALMAYCRERSAQLLVIPGRYKNPTSLWSDSQTNEQWWDSKLVPFLTNQRQALNSNLVLLGDIVTLPTAVSPLSGFESITHGESGILGHPKLQLRTVPTPQNRMPKILTTTGAITVENYTDTKAGKKGEFHHVLGAAVVDLDASGTFHLRQLNARDDGAFCDLDRAFYPDGRVEPSGPYYAVVFGDAHARFADPKVVKATFDKLVPTLDPQYLVWHDLLDAYAVNVHHPGHPFIGIAKHRAGFDNIEDEVKETIAKLVGWGHGRQNIIVASNHDNMLYRWLERTDWRTDPENAVFYLRTALHLAEAAKMTASGAHVIDPFQFWVQRMKEELWEGLQVDCVPPGDSRTIAGIELGLHGHEGPNGVRGTVKNLSQLGVKVISGHSHTPAIEAGHYRTGTMTPLSLEYTGPVGSWLNTHCSIDPMGKRHLHTCINGRFWK